MNPYKTIIVLSIFWLSACASIGPSPVYQGKGGMGHEQISAEVYIYHYQNGFSGPDAMGWPPALQRAWSRLGAARRCGIVFPADAHIASLKDQFGGKTVLHELNGINFHFLISRQIPAFCSTQRVAEIRAALTQYLRGRYFDH